MKKFKLAIIGAVLISGCAAPYQDSSERSSFRFLLPTAMTSAGISVTAINQRMVEVSVGGNAYTGDTRINDYIKLRSAAETLERGYTHYVYVEERDTGRISTSSYVQSIKQPDGSYDSVSRTGSTYFPGGIARVYMMNTDEAPPDAFDAQLIFDQLAPKYIKG